MKRRYYLDYNSTSPFSTKLQSFLAKGDFSFATFANPASVHSSGQKARKLVNETISFLFKTFDLDNKAFSLIFHSGATEASSTFFESAQAGDGFFFCKSDHAATLAVAEKLKNRGVRCIPLAIDSNGDLLAQRAIEDIQNFKNKNAGAKIYLNYLALHNETGVYWPVSEAVKIKAATGAHVHVDATQMPGKVKDWDQLRPQLDAYTFSAHKFGALNGVGFSFINKRFALTPIFKGGGQQRGVRGGTENVLGIYSIKLALEETLQSDLDDLENFRNELEDIIRKKNETLIVGDKSKFGRSVNTVNFILKNQKADISLIQFDLAGLDVSSGSACRAGSIEPSGTLIEMGLSEFAKNGVRISLGPENLKDKEEIKRRLKDVLNKL
ncbi:MAG: aminotransferase class V-fold PLP-dependent enzyme [Bacteriovoracaceae bacterium]